MVDGVGANWMRLPPVVAGWRGGEAIMRAGIGAGPVLLNAIEVGWKDDGAGDDAFTSIDVRLLRSAGGGELIMTLLCPTAANALNPARAVGDARDVRLLVGCDETVGAS